MKNIKLAIMLVLCVALIICSCTDKTEDVKDNANVPETEETENKQEEVIENKLGFENTSLLKAVAECFDKKADELTNEDVLSVRYLAVGPEDDGSVTVYVGLDDYADVYFSENVTLEALQECVKTAVLDGNTESFGDLARFENVEVFEYYDVPINDVSFVRNYKSLAFGYFMNNGITDVSSLEGYNPETLYELDFTGNEIADWTPLYDIKEKVIVNYTLEKMQDESGNEVDVPFVTKLSDLVDEENNEIQQNTDDKENAGVQTTDVTESTNEPEVTYSDIDWSALFGE